MAFIAVLVVSQYLKCGNPHFKYLMSTLGLIAP